MKINILIVVVCLVMPVITNAQDMAVYKIFNSKGEKVSYTQMLEDVKTVDACFFGELHNNPISHWLQYELTASLFAEHGAKLSLGAEMFESDQQLVLSEYISGIVTESKFEADARLWPNYSTDYKMLVNFAKQNELNFIATNIPRRYASIVFKKGFDGLMSLTDQAKLLIAPLPIKYDASLKCYADMLKMGGMPAHANENLPKAQAIKDATMAFFIDKEIKTGKVFLHYNGAYHSDYHLGIVWYLKDKNAKYKIKTISTVIQSNVEVLDKENYNIADYIIVVDQHLTGSY